MSEHMKRANVHFNAVVNGKSYDATTSLYFTAEREDEVIQAIKKCMVDQFIGEVREQLAKDPVFIVETTTIPND